MTQRVELATVMDRLAIDALVTGYAVAVDDGDRDAVVALFVPSGRIDHRTAGGTEGGVREVADRLAGAAGRSPALQHLIVNRRVHVDIVDGDAGDTAQVRADYLSPLRTASGDGCELMSGGRCTFAVVRTGAGWRIARVTVEERWRQSHGSPAARGPEL